LVRKLAKDAGITCTADDILITSGSLQGLDLVNQMLLNKGDTIIIEQATYGGALTRVKRFGVNIVAAPMDKEGLDVDALGGVLDDLKAKGIKPKYVYTIPTVQNPTATILSVERRKALI